MRPPLALTCLLSLCLSPFADDGIAEKHYRSLTNTRASVTNFNPEVIRGLVESPDPNGGFFALNSYASLVQHYTVATFPDATFTYPTLNNPVSIALYGEDLLVVCRGSHALVRHSQATGEILDVIMLRSEPADIVVDDAAHLAWVSCPNDDSVVKVDLGAGAGAKMKIAAVVDQNNGLVAKRPTNLSLEPDGSVLVAPHTSGNNTLTFRVSHITNAPELFGMVFDGYRTAPLSVEAIGQTGIDGFPELCPDPQISVGGGLPDEDLFRIVDGSPPTATGVVRGAATLVTAHGRNPISGEYWMLGVDSHNVARDPNEALLPVDALQYPPIDFDSQPSEPKLRGNFADNVLAIADVDSTSATPCNMPTRWIDLDDKGPDRGNPSELTGLEVYTPEENCSFPWSLSFHPTENVTAIGSSTTPNVVWLNSDGDEIFSVRLDGGDPNYPQAVGKVVRSVLFTERFFYVYCQETGNVLAWLTANPSGLGSLANPYFIASFDLGPDPTPASVKRGREIWYDAVPSLDGRTSCNTCHPSGASDGLIWQISDRPVDEKGAMVTQSLQGIFDSFPYHWRGERDLEDFNGAFPGLLGHDEPLSESDLSDFVDFLFSLRPSANAFQSGVAQIDDVGEPPFTEPTFRLEQDYDRKIKEGLLPPINNLPLVPDATLGESIYHDPMPETALLSHDITLVAGGTNKFSCVDCHSNPTGTNGDFFEDVPLPIASQSNLNVTQLDNQMAFKVQPLVFATVPTALGTVRKFPLLGSGFLHNGSIHTLFRFNNTFDGDEQAALDVTAFTQLFDTGTAPSVHFAVQIANTPTPGEVGAKVADVQRWLIDQAALTVSDPTSPLLGAPQRWVDVCAIGQFPDPANPGQVLDLSWYYDPATQLFHPSDPSLVSAQPFSAFHQQSALLAGASNVFFGVPPGNGRRFIADIDNDGVFLAQELAAGTDPYSYDLGVDDQTAPQLVGPVELDFVNSNQVKLFFETDEPATWRVKFTTPDYPDVDDDGFVLDTQHTAVAHGLAPSTQIGEQVTYAGELFLTDVFGNESAGIALDALISGTQVVSAITTGDQIQDHDNFVRHVVVDSLDLPNEFYGSGSSNIYTAQIEAVVHYREKLAAAGPAEPAPEMAVVLQVLKRVDGNPEADWERVPGASLLASPPQLPPDPIWRDFFKTPFEGIPTIYDGRNNRGQLPGPFIVMLPTDVDGRTTATLRVFDTGGAQIRINVVAVMDATGFDPAVDEPSFAVSDLVNYEFAATDAEVRFVDSVCPGNIVCD